LHVIYKYNFPSDIERHNLRIELQISTKLQHLWATAIEVIDITEKQSIKFGTGAEDWHNFFAIVSSLFALKENSKVFEEHINLSRQELKDKFIEFDMKLKPIEKLKNITHLATNIPAKLNKKTKYCLIILDTEKNEINIIEYSDKNESDAYIKYAEIEQDIMKNNLSQIALLAHADNIKKLKEGYRVYFLDVKDFIIELENLKLE